MFFDVRVALKIADNRILALPFIFHNYRNFRRIAKFLNNLERIIESIKLPVNHFL